MCLLPRLHPLVGWFEGSIKKLQNKNAGFIYVHLATWSPLPKGPYDRGGHVPRQHLLLHRPGRVPVLALGKRLEALSGAGGSACAGRRDLCLGRQLTCWFDE